MFFGQNCKKSSKNKHFSQKKRRGQVWIETVMYTLIALVMIGLVLSFARPKIQELQDRTIIEQSITLMKEIELTITDMCECQGNQRILELNIKKGELTIDSPNDKLIFEIESTYTYSEPDVEIVDGNLLIYTNKIGDINMINITRDFSSSYDLTYDGSDEAEILTTSSGTYRLFFSNEGENENNKIIININTL